MHVIVSVAGCCVPPEQVPVCVQILVKVLLGWHAVSVEVQFALVHVWV